MLQIGSKIKNIFYRLRLKQEGFTLIEILIAITILVWGISYMFPILFNSTAVLHHLDARVEAERRMSIRLWELQEKVRDKEVTDTYHDSEEINNIYNMRFDMLVERLENFNKLFKIKIQASWMEKKKTVDLEKEIYLRTKV